MSVMAQVCGFTLCAFLGALCATIIAWIWMGKIDLSQLISEPSGDASMSRFQLLIFTFVIAISLFVLVEANHGAIPDIPSGVLTLLGISASTYAVSKGISYSQPQLLTPQAGSAPTWAEGRLSRKLPPMKRVSTLRPLSRRRRPHKRPSVRWRCTLPPLNRRSSRQQRMRQRPSRLRIRRLATSPRDRSNVTGQLSRQRSDCLLGGEV